MLDGRTQRLPATTKVYDYLLGCRGLLQKPADKSIDYMESEMIAPID